jgi:hypothetical protein
VVTAPATFTLALGYGPVASPAATIIAALDTPLRSSLAVAAVR